MRGVDFCKKSLRNITDQQKQNHQAVLKDLLECNEEDLQFFDNVITEDESWFFKYYSNTERQNNELYIPPAPWQKKLTCPSLQAQIVNFVFYVEVIKKLF